MAVKAHSQYAASTFAADLTYPRGVRSPASSWESGMKLNEASVNGTGGRFASSWASNSCASASCTPISSITLLASSCSIVDQRGFVKGNAARQLSKILSPAYGDASLRASLLVSRAGIFIGYKDRQIIALGPLGGRIFDGGI